MKLTESQKRKVKGFIKSLLTEAPNKKVKSLLDEDWESIIGMDPSEDDLDSVAAKNLIKYLESNYSVAEITKAINDNKAPNWCFPSGWTAKSPGYPAILAKALNASRSAEPASDIGNIYYSRRYISAEARKEFAKQMFKDPKHAFGDLGPGTDGLALRISGGDDIAAATQEDFDTDVHMQDYLKAPEIKKFIAKYYPQFKM